MKSRRIRRRCKFEIWRDILKVAEKEVVPTRIMAQTVVQYYKFKEALKGMSEAGFLELVEADGYTDIHLTEKGRAWREQISEALELVGEIGDM